MEGHQGHERTLEDALSYLDQVKYKFRNQPQGYRDFVKIMKEFRSQRIDTHDVIRRASTLFREHPELMVGFITFLPLQFRNEMEPVVQAQVAAQVHGHQSSRPSILDALSYLDQVKLKFRNQPQAYQYFLDCLEEFHSRRIDTHGVIQRASTLFREHPELMVGFINFLPLQFRNEMEPIVQAHVVEQMHGHQFDGSAIEEALSYIDEVKFKFRNQPQDFEYFLDCLEEFRAQRLDRSSVIERVSNLFKGHPELMAGFTSFFKGEPNVQKENTAKDYFNVHDLAAKNEVGSEEQRKCLEDLVCSICTELLIKPTFLDCCHIFCDFCIKQWKRIKNDCPICRSEITNMVNFEGLEEFIQANLTMDEKVNRAHIMSERFRAEYHERNPEEHGVYEVIDVDD